MEGRALVRAATLEDFMKNPPDKTEKRSERPGDPQQEWIEAIRRGKEFPEMSQFDYSIPLTDTLSRI